MLGQRHVRRCPLPEAESCPVQKKNHHPTCLSLRIKGKPFSGAVEACVDASQLKVRGFSAVILAFEVAEAYASRCLSLRIRKIMTNSIISPTTRGDKSSGRWRNQYLVSHITGTNRGAAYDTQGG